MFGKFAVTATLALAACDQLPTAVEVSQADYGRPIAQAEREPIAKAQTEPYLKDPYSARYQLSECKRQGINSVPIMGLPKQFGYAIGVAVNARNSFGAGLVIRGMAFSCAMVRYFAACVRKRVSRCRIDREAPATARP